MPYTTNKRLSVQAGGSNSGVWGAGGSSGDDLNTGVMGLIDTQLAGSSAFSVSSSNVTLSYAEVQTCRFTFTGTLLANITVSPDTGGSPIAASYFNGFYFFSNTTSGSFTITLQNAHGSVVLPQGRRGVVYVNTAASIAPQIVGLVGSSTADPIPAGTVMLFFQAAAPSGWTIVGAHNNVALRVVSSSGGGTGGSSGFTGVFTSRTPAGTNSSSACSVTMPFDGYTSTSGGIAGYQTVGQSQRMTENRTLSGTAVAQTFTGTAMDFAVAYLDVILATRD